MEAPRREPLQVHAGPIREQGAPQLSAVLAESLRRAQDADPFVLTHGFHAWPARMHPATARVLVRELAKPGARVLDPFMGSGTVLLEAMLAGHRSAGIDLNPLASLLTRVRCDPRTPDEGRELRHTARLVGEASEERVRSRAPAHAAIPKEMTRLHPGHVLKEMAGLLEEIELVEDARDRAALRVCFSSNVVKLSTKRGDSSEAQMPKRLRKGLVTEFFVRKAEELSERQVALGLELPRDYQTPRTFLGDARRADALLGSRVRVDLVLTSPPYGGTYDYVEHHALRLAWMGMDASEMEKSEIGSRRGLVGQSAFERWDKQLYGVLEAIRHVLDRQGLLVMVVGDGFIEQTLVPALGQLARIAPSAGLELVASASQQRPDWRGEHPREEHVVALQLAI